jgi:hypothetical protein
VLYNNNLYVLVVQHYNSGNVVNQHISIPNETVLVETRIEDGKLLYERRWYKF